MKSPWHGEVNKKIARAAKLLSFTQGMSHEAKELKTLTFQAFVRMLPPAVHLPYLFPGAMLICSFNQFKGR